MLCFVLWRGEVVVCGGHWVVCDGGGEGGARVVRRVRSSHLLITVNSPVIYRRCYQSVSNGQRLWTPSTNKRADQPSDNVKQYSDRLDSPLGRPLHLSSHDLLTVPAYTSCCTISCHSHGFLHTVPLLHMKTAGLWMLWLIRHTKFYLSERCRVNARVFFCQLVKYGCLACGFLEFAVKTYILLQSCVTCIVGVI